jgi:hypothetical protein
MASPDAITVQLGGLDLSGAGLSLQAATTSPASLPPAFLYVAVAKDQVFPSGVAYRAVFDASGLLAQLTGQASASSASAAHLASQAATAAGWWSAGAPDTFDASYSFGGRQAQLRLSVPRAAAVLNATGCLGRQLMLLVSRAHCLADTGQESDVFADGQIFPALPTLHARLAAAVRSALATADGQGALVRALVAANGPVVPLAAAPATPGGSEQAGSLAFAADWNDLLLCFNVPQLPFVMGYYGAQRLLTLDDVPLVLWAASGGAPVARTSQVPWPLGTSQAASVGAYALWASAPTASGVLSDAFLGGAAQTAAAPAQHTLVTASGAQHSGFAVYLTFPGLGAALQSFAFTPSGAAANPAAWLVLASNVGPSGPWTPLSAAAPSVAAVWSNTALYRHYAVLVTAAGAGGNLLGPVLLNRWELSAVDLPVTAGLVGYYDADSWDVVGNRWLDKSGSGNHTVSTVGAVSIAQRQNGRRVLSGDQSAKIAFPAAILPPTYTLFYISRYNGAKQGRILDGVDTNWLSGHRFIGGKPVSGVAFHNGSLTQYATSVHGTNWVLGTDQNALYRSNGVDRTIYGPGAPSYANLGINTSTYAFDTSDWAVGFVVVYNRTLALAEIQAMEAHLNARYAAY